MSKLSFALSTHPELGEIDVFEFGEQGALFFRYIKLVFFCVPFGRCKLFDVFIFKAIVSQILAVHLFIDLIFIVLF